MQSWIFMRVRSRLSLPGPAKSCVSLTLIILTCWQRAKRQRNKKETAKSGSALEFTTNFLTQKSEQGSTFASLLVSDALNRNPAYLTGDVSSFQNDSVILCSHDRLRWNPSSLNKLQNGVTANVLPQNRDLSELIAQAAMMSAHCYVTSVHLQGHAWWWSISVTASLCYAVQNSMALKVCVFVCACGGVCLCEGEGGGCYLTIPWTGKHAAGPLWHNWRPTPGF